MIRLTSSFSSLIPSALLVLALPLTLPAAGGGELTPAQHARLLKYLPNSLPKLEKNEPVHALIVGDSVMNMFVHTDDDADTLKSYPGVFLSQLSDQFYYTGGLRVMRPARGKPEKGLQSFGKEVTVRNASRSGKLMIHAMSVLDTVAWDEKPDIVMVSFGIGDATARHSLASYRRAVQDVIDVCRKNNADLILIGPTPTIADPPEQGLALTRPYADTMQEVARAGGVFFADLGDISWLVHVDEPMKNLESPPPKKPSEEETGANKKQPGAPTPGALIKIPLPEELDPDPDKRAARLFQQVSNDLRRWFDHGGTIDPLHPNPSLHRLLGRRLFAELLDGPRPVPWSMGASNALLNDTTHCDVSYRIENTTNDTLRVSLLPLVTANWKPKDAETQVELKAGRKGLVAVSYERSGNSADAIPPHEAMLRLPVLVLGNGVARIEDLHARLQPFTMLWNLGAQFNQEGGTTVTGRIVNNSAEPLAGKWEAEWLGQKFSGDFNAPARAEAPVKISVKLPIDGTPITRQRGTLAFTVTSGALSLTCPRELEIVQNIGLKQTITLLASGQYEGGKPAAPPAPAPSRPGTTLRVDADPQALYFTWDIQGMNLVENSDGVAVRAEVNIDGRSYGKRLAPGVTESLRISASAADNPANISGVIQPWTFGNGYGVTYDRKAAQAILSSRPDGSRRLTLMLPRSLFHQHEWALGNGNSQLGLSTRLDIWQPPDDKNREGADLNFALFENSLHRDDAESLAVLELTPQPTQRWTVHFY